MESRLRKLRERCWGHADLSEAIVVSRDNELGEASLVAYFTTADQPCPKVSELRGFLAEKLPEYMVPSAFVKMDTMPLMPNGKIDRRALPTPNKLRPESDKPFVEPRTAVEEELAKIWLEVLGLDRVGIHDSFFDLGGDSLLATQILSRIRNALDVDLPLNTLFDKAEIAELAQAINDAKGKE